MESPLEFLLLLFIYFIPIFFAIQKDHPSKSSIAFTSIVGLVSCLYFAPAFIIVLWLVFLIWSLKDYENSDFTKEEIVNMSKIGPIKRGDIKVKGVYVPSETLTDGATIKERILPLSYQTSSEYGAKIEDVIPEINIQKLKVVSKDDRVYDYNGIYVKPDVIFEADKGLHIVVEIKSREISGQCALFNMNQADEIHSYFDKDILQVMVSAWVYGKSKSLPENKILPIVRYKDYLIALSWDIKLEQTIEFYSGLYLAWLGKNKDEEQTVSATDLSTLICVMDSNYKESLQDSKLLASVRGELIHLIAIHGRDIQAIKDSFLTAREATVLE